ncbi:MAG: helical backbone metal receptor [Pedobacter sp.]|nr:helical backbone metal receptor [Pedobacter sp.]
MRHFLFFFLCFFPLAAAALTLSDADGKTLTVHAPAQRIISLAPHFTDMLQAMGAGKQIVAVSDDHDSRGRYTRSLSGYPLVGDAAALNYERIVAYKPDAIIAWGSGTPRAWIEQLRHLGLPVVVLEARSLQEIGGQLGLLGRLTGHEAEAAKQQEAFAKALQGLQGHAAGPRLRYFYQIWSQPLYSLGRQHLLSQALALCGADNIVPTGPVMAPLINPEFVFKADPDVIFFGKVDEAASRSYWSRFSQLKAVRQQHLLAVDDRRLTRPGPDMLAAVAPLCAHLSGWRTDASRK